jgi:dCMP deaminase
MESKWIARFLDLTKKIASWSKDPTQVGAVIVRPDRTICSVGFNGFPRGIEDSRSAIADRDTKLLRTIHAELNAILSSKESLVGYSHFVWPFQPCSQCAAAIIQSGIKDVYCPFTDHSSNDRWSESFKSALQMLDEANVRVIYS